MDADATIPARAWDGPDAIGPLITVLGERHGFENLTVFGRGAECRVAVDA